MLLLQSAASCDRSGRPSGLNILPNVPGSDKFWTIRYDQIIQHLEDYADNAVIDKPIDAIFAWPGRGSRFFKTYNGFELPKDFYRISWNFIDWNQDVENIENELVINP